MLERLSTILKGDAFIPTAAVFPDIDTDRVARDLRLKEKAADRGGRNLPGSDETSPDAVEISIIDRIEELRRKGLNNYAANKEVYSKRLSLASTAHLEVKSVAGSAEGDFELEVRAWQARMAGLVKHLRDWTEALASFRSRHRLDRPAYDSGSLVMTAVILLSCFGLETALNGYLFAQKNDLGYLGGFLIAALVSLVNISMASVCLL